MQRVKKERRAELERRIKERLRQVVGPVAASSKEHIPSTLLPTLSPTLAPMPPGERAGEALTSPVPYSASAKATASASGSVSKEAQLTPGSEQSLGRLLERMDSLERQMKLIYRLLWRTSAALVGLFAAGTGWDWVVRLFK